MNQVKTKINFTIRGKHAKNILIDAFIPQTEHPCPVIIFSHGFKGFKDWGPFNHIAGIFAAAGFAFVKFNFSYNGTTADQPMHFADLDAFGNNNFTKELDDLESVIDWVHAQAKQLHFDLSKVSLLGHSRGGGIAILKAAEDNRVKSLATWAAVADFSRFITSQDISRWKASGVHFVENVRTGQMMPLYLQLYFDYIQNQQRLHIKSAVGKLRVPLLIVHGTADDTVPVHQAEELHFQNEVNSSLMHIEGADHTFGAAHPFDEVDLPPHFQVVVRETLHFLRNSYS